MHGMINDPHPRVLTMSVEPPAHGQTLRLVAQPPVTPGQLIQFEDCEEKAVAEGWGAAHAEPRKRVASA